MVSKRGVTMDPAKVAVVGSTSSGVGYSSLGYGRDSVPYLRALLADLKPMRDQFDDCTVTRLGWLRMLSSWCV